MEDDQPWKQGEDETNKQFKAFECYKGLGKARTIWGAWLAYCEWNWGKDRRAKEEQKKRNTTNAQANGTFTRWYYDNDWQDRANAWDRHMRSIAQEKAERRHIEKLEDHMVRQEQFAKVAMNNAVRLMQAIQKRIAKLDDKDLANVKDLTRLTRANIALFQAATDAEAQVLAVDEVITVLDGEGKLE